MDNQIIGAIIFLVLLAIAVFSYFQSSTHAEALDRRRRSAAGPDSAEATRYR